MKFFNQTEILLAYFVRRCTDQKVRIALIRFEVGYLPGKVPIKQHYYNVLKEGNFWEVLI